MDRNAAPVNPPSVAMMLDEEDKMFRDALIESQKEYAAFLDSWPTFSDYTKVFLLLFFG
ncbi:BnaC03g47780D [Brassica napus]|uniref:BnaC03g47780D protein n=1 Tax=Brassica napus TaxID=3708 RepID=A0A078F461_BRANA|nr:BnaC03g47780D [Brassica napus]